MKRTVVLLQLIMSLLLPAAAGGISLADSSSVTREATMEGLLFFDRGHYWIEVHLEGWTGPSPGDRELFTIIDGSGSIFSPSRVEVLEWMDDRGVIILSSGRLKGRSCYRVLLDAGEGMSLETGTVCDPFFRAPEAKECAAKRFFRRHIAPAFSRSGEAYRLNRFSYGYDLSGDRSRTDLVINPLFEIGGWDIEPSFEYREKSFMRKETDDLPVFERAAGLDLSRSGWAQGLGLRLICSYDHERFLLRAPAGDSVRYAHSIRVTGIVRLDNLFDGLNRHCLSVFKGIDLGAGYAWFVSNDEEVWGEGGMESTTPFLLVRATWTLLYGLQCSYSLESYWPSTLNERFEEFHALRVRLLLRDLLEKERRRSYHPDLEFVLDTGRRLPLFDRERRISVGFTFALFPW